MNENSAREIILVDITTWIDEILLYFNPYGADLELKL